MGGMVERQILTLDEATKIYKLSKDWFYANNKWLDAARIYIKGRPSRPTLFDAAKLSDLFQTGSGALAQSSLKIEEKRSHKRKPLRKSTERRKLWR